MNISLVSYLNSQPYLFGLLNANKDLYKKLEIVNPAQCAKNFSDNISDVALVPVGALSDISNYKIIKPFCISADGEVRSVLLLSKKPIEEVKNIAPDSHSKSSNILLKILCKNFWKISPAFVKADSSLSDARLTIGDKAFELQKKYPYKYDLSLKWKEMTGLPFVFAVWIASNDIKKDQITKLSTALEDGINNVEAAISHFDNKFLSDTESYKYLSENINYKLNNYSEKGMKTFLEMAAKII